MVAQCQAKESGEAMIIHGFDETKRRSLEFFEKVQSWMRATSLGLADLRQGEIPLYETHKTSIVENCFSKVSLDSGYEDSIYLLHASSYYQRGYETPSTCRWNLKILTFQSFLNRLIYRLKKKGYVFKGSEFKALVVLYLFSDPRFNEVPNE